MNAATPGDVASTFSFDTLILDAREYGVQASAVLGIRRRRAMGVVMSDGTKIEWCDASWNPIRAKNRATGKVGWFCIHQSDGCKLCYAETFNARLGTGVDYKAQNADKVEVFLDERTLMQPLRWRKPRVIFVCSMTDLFGEFVTDAMIDRVFAVMALCPQHTFIVLTKRSTRMREYFSDRTARNSAIGRAVNELSATHVLLRHALPLPNVWLGVSIEDRRNGVVRGPELALTPAAVRLWSVEPLLSDLGDMTQLGLFDTIDGKRKAVDWVIVGGESGREARPMCVAWARSIRDQCSAAGVAFFFKQHGEFAPRKVNEPFDTVVRAADGAWGRLGEIHGADIYPMLRVGKKAAGRLLDGVEHNARPPLKGD